MADEKTVKLRVEGNADSAVRSVRETGKSLDELEGKARRAGAAIGDTTSRAERLGSAADRLSREQLAGANRAMEEGSASASRYGAGLGALFRIAATGGVVAVSTLAALSLRAIGAAADMKTLSDRLGITTEELSALGAAAKRNDADLGTMVGGLNALETAAARAATGVGNGARQVGAAFAALDVQVLDARGNIRPTVDLLSDVAVALERLPPGALKAQLAQQLLSASGRELQATLDELAHRGLQGVIDKAAETGQVIDSQTAAAAKRLKDDLEALQTVIEGYANRVAADVLPNLLRFAEGLRDVSEREGEVGDSTTLVGDALRGVISWFIEAHGWAQRLGVAFGDFVARAELGYEKLKVKFTDTGWLKTFAAALTGQAGAINALHAMNAKIDADFEQRRAAIVANTDASFAAIDASVSQHLANINGHLADFSNVVGGTGPVLDAAATAAEAEREALERQRAALEGAAAGHGKLATEAAKATKPLLDNERAAERLTREIARLQQGNAALIDDLARGRDILQGLTPAQVEYNAALRATNEEIAHYLELGPPTIQQMEAVEALLDRQVLAQQRLAQDRSIDAYQEQMRAAQQQAEESRRTWLNLYEGLADATVAFFTGQIRSWKDFGRALVSVVQQFVAEVIKRWLMMKLVGGGGGGGWLGALGLAASGSASAGGLGSLFGGGGGGGGGFDIFSGASWINAGKNIWSGFQQGYAAVFDSPSATSASTIFGSYTGAQGGLMYAPGAGGSQLGLVPNYAAGAPGSIGVAPGSYSYTPSTLGYAAAGAAGLYAGYQRWQGSGQDVGGALGAAAYGVGTYSATIAAGAALSGGMAAGLAAIPVVGWIALAAMAVDMLSGGKLFGTKGKLHHTNLSLDVGAEGVSLAQSYTLKGQKAFFGGTRWTTKDVTPSDEAVQAAQEFYDALTRGREQFAQAFNAEVGSLVGGTFNAEYDKKGNLTSSSSTVRGVTYEGETQEQFAQRLTAENMIDVLSQFDSSISELVNSYRANVDDLMSAANAFAIAQQAYQSGVEFLALGSDQTLSAVFRLAEGMQAAGETIDQTMQRLVQAQAQYDQFVGQFEPPREFGSQFQADVHAVYVAWRQNEAQANALARAAGAQGAAERDLANIRQYAQAQIEVLIGRLRGSLQAGLEQLGYVPSTNLDYINQRIAELEARAGQAGAGIGAAADAMADATSRIRDQISLLLGDLSPLNDQEKLQTALEALRAGNASREDVLRIGRRLYASGSDYDALFAQVMAIRVPGSTPASASGGRGLSASEQAELQRLRQQRDAAEATQRVAQAQNVAQMIADLHNATGQSYADIAEEFGFQLSRLAQDLHLDNDALTAYLDSLAAQDPTQSFADGAATITDAILQIGNRIVSAILDGVDSGPLIVDEDGNIVGSGRSARGVGGGRRGGPLPRGGRGTGEYGTRGDGAGSPTYIPSPPPANGPAGADPKVAEMQIDIRQVRALLERLLPELTRSSGRSAAATEEMVGIGEDQREELVRINRGGRGNGPAGGQGRVR